MINIFSIFTKSTFDENEKFRILVKCKMLNYRTLNIRPVKFKRLDRSTPILSSFELNIKNSMIHMNTFLQLNVKNYQKTVYMLYSFKSPSAVDYIFVLMWQ